MIQKSNVHQYKYQKPTLKLKVIYYSKYIITSIKLQCIQQFELTIINGNAPLW